MRTGYRLASVATLALLLIAAPGCSSLGGESCEVCPPAPAPVAQAPYCPPVQQPCAPVANAPTRPPDAQCGEVWCYIRIPEQTRTVCEQVCVQPATSRQEWVPPETREVCEQVCVRPAETKRIPIPAKFETVTEQVMTCPSKCEWRRVDCQPTSLQTGEQVGECWRLVEIPPVYESRCKQVCVQPESCTEEVIPAAYESRTRTVTVREGYYKCIEVPAVFETRTRQEIVCAARWEWRRTAECEVPAGAPTVPAVPGDAAPSTEPFVDDYYGTGSDWANDPGTGSPDAAAPPEEDALDDLPPAGGYQPEGTDPVEPPAAETTDEFSSGGY
jgi:hypothetical protein